MSSGNCLADGVKDWLLAKLTTRTSNPAGLGMELYLSFCACFMCVNDIVAPAKGYPDLGNFFKVSEARGIEGLWALFLHSDDASVVTLAKNFLLLLYGKAFFAPSTQQAGQSSAFPDLSVRDKELAAIDELDEDDNYKAVLKESVMEQYPQAPAEPAEEEATEPPFDERYLLIEQVSHIVRAVVKAVLNLYCAGVPTSAGHAE